MLVVLSLLFPLVPSNIVWAENQENEETTEGVGNTPEPPDKELLEETEETVILVEETKGNDTKYEEIEDNKLEILDDSLFSDDLKTDKNFIGNKKPYEVVDILPRDQENFAMQSTFAASYDQNEIYYVDTLRQNEYNPKNPQDLTISIENGNVGYVYNLVSIPGANNSVMSLDLEYNSTESKFAIAPADITDAKDYYLEPSLYYDTEDSLGAGWKFSGLKRRYSDRYYMLRDGRVVNEYNNTNDYKYYSIAQDTISYIDGTIEQINSDGYIEYIEDKYGNRIDYQYEKYTNVENNSEIRLKTITDNQNRSISIDYYSDYVQITRPNGTQIRLNTDEIMVEHIAEDRGFDATLPAKVISSIYDVSTNTNIADFGYEDVYFKYIFAGDSHGVMIEDCGAFMVMNSFRAAYSTEHFIEYDVIADNNYYPSIPSYDSKYWYLCAVKDYTTSSKTSLRASYEYEFAVKNVGTISKEINSNNKVTKITSKVSSQIQEIFERNNNTDVLKQSTQVQYSNDYHRERPASVISKKYNSNGNYITSSINYSYDKYGNIETSTEKVEDNVRFENSYTYYDNSYKSLKDVELKKGSEIFNRTEYEVNTLGDITNERIYDGDNNLQKRTKYSYSNNNLTQTTIYDPVTAISCQIEKYSYTGPYMTKKYSISPSIVLEDEYYTYDNDTGQVISIRNVNGTENIEYDSLGRVVRKNYTDGCVKDIGYYPSSNTMWVTDENGYALGYSYNSLGKVERVSEDRIIYGASTLQQIGYDNVGNPISVTDALNNTTNITYDTFGRQISVQHPELTVTTDAKYLDVIIEGNNKYSVYLTRSETGRISCEYYDVYGRLVKTAFIKNYLSFNSASFDNISQMPSNAELVVTARYVYDDLDRVIEQYDGENRPTYYTYDCMGNVINMVQGKGEDYIEKIDISYEYDAAGNVTKITQGTHITTYEYDKAGRLIKMTDPMGYTETYAYDTAGNIETFKDKNGTITTNTYNNRGWLSATMKGGECITYTYDGVGNILTNDTITYAYNDDGTLASKSYLDGKSMSYSYNDNKVITSMIDYLGNVTNYTYNSRGELMSIAEKYAGTNITNTIQYAYNTDGSLQKVTYPLSSYTTTQYTYDYAGRISNLTNKLTSSSTYSTHSYKYDNSGNITQKIDNIQGNSMTTTYDYDDVNRLTCEKRSIGGHNNYTYDQYNNLVAEIGWGDTYYYYDANNRLTKIDDLWCPKETNTGTVQADWESSLTYDKNGNLLSYNTETTYGKKSNQKSYTYDVWDRLTNFSDSLGATVSYDYYSDGLRASKTIGSDTTRYYYDGDDVINETLNGNNYATNVLGIGGYISRRQNGTTGYLFKDAHGDVLSAYSSTTNKLADYTYTAWGINRTANETSAFINNPLRYCGEYYDYESGMTYLRARYYDSSIKRFISEDTAKDGVNWYAYCGNNPVMFVDPSGNITEEEMQMYENNELSPGAYSYLMKLTYNYLLADNDNDRNYYNKLADDFRKTNYTKTEFGGWNFIISNMKSRPSGGKVEEWEHYYRNNLNIEFSYDELMKLNEKLPDNMKWTTVVASFHQNHTVDGKENVKYVSGCGHFEIVFNARNEIQNQYNNTDDMGTYNYYSPTSHAINHTIYDVRPYSKYKNVPNNARRIP